MFPPSRRRHPRGPVSSLWLFPRYLRFTFLSILGSRLVPLGFVPLFHPRRFSFSTFPTIFSFFHEKRRAPLTFGSERNRGKIPGVSSREIGGWVSSKLSLQEKIEVALINNVRTEDERGSLDPLQEGGERVRFHAVAFVLVILIRFLRSLVGNGPRIKIAFEGISEKTLPLLGLR